ncbi:helix-turn-helix domain-containing protein [Chryseobacterium sp. GP-SGM7]|uniref:helix-turn-helix domain-containing protein n=1 Tax=Chryseobacterium sp. GP-SGM7 TaxID=3411323 RepID=UPI003B94B29F
MNNVISKNIRKYRELKGFSQEFMASQLDINQASYAKIENSSTKLTVERLFAISKLLETDITDLLDLKAQTVFNQSENEVANAYGKIENFYNESREVYEKLIQSKNEQIDLMKELLLQKNK